MNKREM